MIPMPGKAGAPPSRNQRVSEPSKKSNMRWLPCMLLLTTGFPCYSQPDGNRLNFDTAAVRRLGPNASRADFGLWRGGPGSGSPGRFTMPCATLAQIIAKAYDVWYDQIIGPDWIIDWGILYSLAATLPANTTDEQFRAMMQNLLAERFHLRLHHVTQTRPGYELVVADGGPKIKEWTPADSEAVGGLGAAASRFPKLNAQSGPAQAVIILGESGVTPILMTARKTMAMFCRELGAQINVSEGRPFDAQTPRVVDKTGLAGIYEFHLEYAGMVRSVSWMPPSAAIDSGPAIPSDPAPSLFTAIEGQLGLKLRKLKNVSVDVLVVDHADKVPTEN
jgi:uncharacterized protein (TIGR03435 family)